MSLIVYVSVEHGNTAKIAHAMAGELNAKIVEAKDFKPEMLDGHQLIGFGSGIYRHRPHKSLVELLKSLPLGEGRRTFIFSTSGSGKYRHKIMRYLLGKKGFQTIGEVACQGFDHHGPYGVFKLLNIQVGVGLPGHEDEENARRFAANLKG